MTETKTTSRAVALRLLAAVLGRKLALDDARAHEKGMALLDGRDRGFSQLLVLTVLRRLGQIDAVLALCLTKKDQLKAPVQDLLRLGAAQLLFLKTPPHAAVDAMVELAGEEQATRPFKGLINAVLRRLAREGEALLKTQDAARLNTPDWLWVSWRKSYGIPFARAIASAHLLEAPTDLTVKPDALEATLAAIKAAALEAGSEGEAILLPTGSVRLPQGLSLAALDGFASGSFWAQDAAAALPARFLGDVKGARVLDLCAAPGGKTMQLALAGAKVTALDRSAPRLERLSENMARAKFEVEIVTSDALSYRPKEKFPFVLLDAPCSATGTIRRHPDVQRHKSMSDVTRLAALQASLLDHVAAHVLARGGTMVYAVCSLQREEAEAQIEAFLERTPSMSRAPLTLAEVFGQTKFLTQDGALRTLPSFWPEQGGMDGFYAARLVAR